MRNTIVTLTRVLVIAGLILAPQMSFASGKDNDNGRGNNNNSSYGRDNYDSRGYDRDGYDHDGFDRGGFDRDGFDRHGRDARGHEDKVTICHHTAHGSQTITISHNALPAHLADGDTLGPCAASGSH